MDTTEKASTNGGFLTADAKDLMCEKLLASEELEQKTPVVIQQYVSPRIITGLANQHNITRGAISWGYNGLVAYGSNYTVVIVDTRNMQAVQCLDRHKAIINNVLWSDRIRPKVDDTASVEIVSSDVTGHIIHWDITIGIPLVVLQDGNKPVIRMEWVPGERNELLLATLHTPYYLVMWDINKQTKLWKKGFLDNIYYFQFNPFNTSEIAFLCTDCILFLDDFNPNKTPSSNGRKCYISSPRVGELEDSSRTRDRLKKVMKGLVIGDSKPRADDTMTLSECLGLTYHRSLRNHILLQYTRDILVIDLLLNQTVGIIAFEKAMTPLVQVIPARQRDVLYCLHESGSVSVKVRKKTAGGTILASPLDAPTESISSMDMTAINNAEVYLSYEHRCQSEVIRQMKGSKVLAITLDPMTERNIVLLLSSGKVVHLELDIIRPDFADYSPLFLSQMLSPAIDDNGMVPPLRLMTTGLLSAVASPLTVIRMCPPLTTRNRLHYSPIMAGGTISGIVQIYNMATGIIEKELALHNHPVRGIEWTGLASFLSFSFCGQTSKVVNELLLTDVQSGQCTPIRQNRPAENPIDMVRVSPLRQYFVVVYKDGPFELWDLKTLTLLRTMPKKFPFVTALEWSPVHSIKSLHAKAVQRKSVEEQAPESSPITETGNELVAKEHLVFSDTESHLYHFSVDGTTVRDGIKIPPESGVGMITCIAFKSNQIVQADVDGCLNIWDLKSRSSRNSHTGRGWIRKIRFSPGKGNLKLLILYSDGVDIVDLKNLQYERLAQLKCPKDMLKIVDIDWAAPGIPVLATEDGCLRIMDCKLTQSVSSLSDYSFKDPVCCPPLLPLPVYDHLQLLLSTNMLGAPSFTFTVEDGFPLDQLQAVNDQVGMMELELLESNDCSIAKRCLIAALLLRNQTSVDFWTVCQYYLQVASCSSDRGSQKPKHVEHFDSYTASDLKRINQFPKLQPLDTCYDILCDPYIYQKLQLERVTVLEWRRGDYRHTQKVVERMILLGEMDRAVQLLLETDLDNPNYYTDGIKACLVATIQSTGAAQSTIKLVATNLIANGKIWEGVQLLCLIGKGLDGCRYLSSYGLWESAVWLAKSTLPPLETLEVLRKWADHLNSLGEKETAVQVLVSQGQFDRVLELLLTHGNVVRAGLLLLALMDIRYCVDKSLFSAVQSQFYENARLCAPLADAVLKLQPTF